MVPIASIAQPGLNVEGSRLRLVSSPKLNCQEMHTAMGQDCWVVVPIASIAQPGLHMEGLHLS